MHPQREKKGSPFFARIHHPLIDFGSVKADDRGLERFESCAVGDPRERKAVTEASRGREASGPQPGGERRARENRKGLVPLPHGHGIYTKKCASWLINIRRVPRMPILCAPFLISGRLNSKIQFDPRSGESWIGSFIKAFCS